MKKKSKSILAIVLAILLVIVVAISLTTNILFSRKDTPKIFGHYIYLMEYDTMEAAAGAAVATGTSGQAAGSVDDTSAAASIHQHTAVIASAYKETDPIAKNNAVLCVLAPDDASTDIDSDRVAVRRIYNIEQDETGVLKYYPTTMKASDVGTEPPVTVDSILGKCSYESGELYTYVKFATGVPGILILMVLPSIILVIMLIVTIVRASMGHDDEYTFEENYDEVYSEDSYDDGDSAYDDEELGGRSPLYRPSEATQSRSFEKKRSSIAENFERKQVNPNSPYQKARTMQFKAQHDVPIYTNPADQLPLDGSAPAAGSNTYSTPPITDETPVAPAQPEAPVSTYRGSHEASSPEEARNLGDTPFRSSRASAPAPAPKPAAPSVSKNKEDRIASASVDELLAMIEDEKKKL